MPHPAEPTSSARPRLRARRTRPMRCALRGTAVRRRDTPSWRRGCGWRWSPTRGRGEVLAAPNRTARRRRAVRGRRAKPRPAGGVRASRRPRATAGGAGRLRAIGGGEIAAPTTATRSRLSARPARGRGGRAARRGAAAYLDALVATAETVVHDGSGPTACASAEEMECVLRWLEAPGTRLVEVLGTWSHPAHGAGGQRRLLDFDLADDVDPFGDRRGLRPAHRPARESFGARASA